MLRYQDSGKPALTSYLLKNSTMVNEAPNLLRGIDIYSAPLCHLKCFRPERCGRACGQPDGSCRIGRHSHCGLCATKLNVGHKVGDPRYEILCRRHKSAGGVMNSDLRICIPTSVDGQAHEYNLDDSNGLTNPSVTYFP